jgi:hypothetical protein
MDELKRQIFNLAMKLKYQGRAWDARIAALEDRLGIPTPPKHVRELPPPADRTGI